MAVNMKSAHEEHIKIHSCRGFRATAVTPALDPIASMAMPLIYNYRIYLFITSFIHYPPSVYTISLL